MDFPDNTFTHFIHLTGSKPTTVFMQIDTKDVITNYKMTYLNEFFLKVKK